MSAEQLLQLSEEVSRIAGTLARLTMDAGVARPALESSTGPAKVSAEAIRKLIQARRHRARFFDADLFADPAWDMMLELLEAEMTHRRVVVSSLCLAAAVPATTALRWLNTMVERGLFLRRSDPRDGRRVFVELSPEASRSLRQYFAETSPFAGT
jgi:DNA-binding MarR family transcriptional regulator